MPGSILISDSAPGADTPNEKFSEDPLPHDAPRASVESGRSADIPKIVVEEVISADKVHSDEDQEEPKQEIDDIFKAPASSPDSTSERSSVDGGRNQFSSSQVTTPGVQKSSGDATDGDVGNYLQTIDELQAKLQQLGKEAATSAHEAAMAAQPGSAEKKLLEKDEKIALLMEEGQKLSRNEMKHLMTIKKLRSQAAQEFKNQTAITARAEKSESGFRKAEQRASAAEAAMRQAEQSLSISLEADRNFDALRGERDALTNTIAQIRSELVKATKRAEKAECKAQNEAAAQEQKQVADLRADLSSAKAEREIGEGKLRQELKDSNELLEQERQHSRDLKSELQAEQFQLEGKMEALRSRAEEASSSSLGDAQAKLLRQVETLQSQHAVAKEKWQGIETSLLARITQTEKERASLEEQEIKSRNKLGVANMKIKSAELEAKMSKDEIYRLEQRFAEQELTIQKLQRQLTSKEELLSEAKRDIEEVRHKWQTEMAQRMSEQHQQQIKSKEQMIASPNSRAASPICSARKGVIPLEVGLGLESTGNSPVIGRNQSRRSSTMPLHSTPQTSNATPQETTTPTIQQHSPVSACGSGMEQEDDFAEQLPIRPPTATPSVGTNCGINDIVSASTMGAGPSVQLVERMSASVRRLESEKAVWKDELARLTAQRDESRKEVVMLMQEVEQKRAGDKRIESLEEELKQVDQRHQTTLEMLGEKSELVEELRADVADIKQMYRDLVDNTMKE